MLLRADQHRLRARDRSQGYERELRGAEKTKEDAAGLLKSSELLRHRYGTINMQVGQILTFGEMRREIELAADATLTPAKRRTLVTRLGNRVMDEINRVTAVTPGALTALSLLSHEQRGIGHAELIDYSAKLLSVAEGMGARTSQTLRTASGALRPEALREACQMFIDADVVEIQFLEDPAASGKRPAPARPTACCATSGCRSTPRRTSSCTSSSSAPWSRWRS